METNLIEIAKSGFTGDIVQRLGSWLGEKPEATRRAINDAVPSVVAGMADQASSESGVRTLYEMAKQSGGTTGQLDTHLDTGADASSFVEKGQGLLSNLFGGDRVSDMTEKVASHAGVSTSVASKILGLVSPVVMGILGKQITSGNLGLSSFANLLAGQKAAYAGAFDDTRPMGTERWRQPVAGTRPATLEGPERKAGFSWLPLLLVLAGGLALLGLLRGRNADNARRETARTPTETAAPAVAAPEVLGTSGQALASYLDSATAQFPKRFVMDGVQFATDSPKISGWAPASVDAIVSTLKSHPNAKIRIEGFTDNVGDAAANQVLSQQRADSVRDRLVDHGIDASRIETAGFGADRPIASNDSSEGRAQNRRMEMVVLSR